MLGKLALHLWFRPTERLVRCIQEGGPWEQARTRAGHEEMKQAATLLPPLAAPSGQPMEVHLLTGDRFWDQTAFCLFSLQNASDRPVYPVIYDDGHLGPVARGHLERVCPHIRFVDIAETKAKLDELLPRSRFPFLRDRWEHYPNIRKLTDPHLGSTGWKLVLDSDLLFFGKPDLLLNWSTQPDRPLHAIDVEESYGYTRARMERLCGHRLDEKVNVGICGLRSDEIDWEKLEAWCADLITHEKTNYYLEQALVAMLVAGQRCDVAPAADYITLPRQPEATDCQAIMHHYVAESKRWYFQTNWRQFAQLAP